MQPVGRRCVVKTMTVRTLLLALASGMLAFGCVDTKPAKVQRSIRLAYVPYSSSLPALVAQENGLFAAQQLQVELRRVDTSNEAMAALLQGEVDGIMGIGLASLLAVEIKTPGKFKMSWHAVETGDKAVNALLVPTSSPMRGIEDLRGRTVGTFVGATQLLNLHAIFQKALGDPDAVQVAQVSPALQLQVLEQGELAGLFTIEPNVTIALDRGIGRILVDNPRCKYILDPFPAGGGILSTAFLTDRKEEAARLVVALDGAIEAIRSDEASAKAILPKYLPIEQNIAAKSRLYAWWTSREANPAILQTVADQLSGGGFLTGHVDAGRLLYQTP